MRKLVSIRKVIDILPIEGADLIELAVIDGWNCVVKKGEFNVGDLGVYFEIESNIPISEDGPFKFLMKDARPDQEGVLRARIKSRRLRGQISQGLLVPITALNGFDLSSVFGVEKYEPTLPACLGGLASGKFPQYITKTDQERIQNLPHVFVKSAENKLTYEETVKLNGSSMTVFYQTKYLNNEEGVCSRNLQLKLDQEGNTFIDIAKKYDIIGKLKAYHEKTGRSLAVQGELIGEGIQKNYEKIKGQDFYVFDIFDIDNGCYLLPNERRALTAELGLKHVPVLNESADINRFSSIADVLAYAEGPGMNPAQKVREGVVFKSNELVNGNTFTFKAISNKYLLGHDTDD